LRGARHGRDRSSPAALIALRLNQPIPKSVMTGGFALGHSLLGSSTWKVVHLAFQFYGFATYNALLIRVTQPRARCSPPWSRLVATSSSRWTPTAAPPPSAPISATTPSPACRSTWRGSRPPPPPTRNTARRSRNSQPILTEPDPCVPGPGQRPRSCRRSPCAQADMNTNPGRYGPVGRFAVRSFVLVLSAYAYQTACAIELGPFDATVTSEEAELLQAPSQNLQRRAGRTRPAGSRDAVRRRQQRRCAERGRRRHASRLA
jgi:hypothetical protein